MLVIKVYIIKLIKLITINWIVNNQISTIQIRKTIKLKYGQSKANLRSQHVPEVAKYCCANYANCFLEINQVVFCFYCMMLVIA